MSLRLKYGEVTRAFTVDLTTHLVDVGINPEYIVDATVTLKAVQTLADDAAGTYQAMLGGAISRLGYILTVQITNFTGLLIDTKYYIGVGYKLGGDSSFREADLVVEDSTLYLTQDDIRG